MRVAQNIFQSFVTSPSLTLYIWSICQSHWFYLQNVFRIQLPLMISTATIQAPLDYCKKGSSLGWGSLLWPFPPHSTANMAARVILLQYVSNLVTFLLKTLHWRTMKVKSPKMTCWVLPDWALRLLSDFISYCSSFASSAPSTLAPLCSVNILSYAPAPGPWHSVCNVLPANICMVCSLTSFTSLIKVSCQWGLLLSPFLEL